MNLQCLECGALYDAVLDDDGEAQCPGCDRWSKVIGTPGGVTGSTARSAPRLDERVDPVRVGTEFINVAPNDACQNPHTPAPSASEVAAKLRHEEAVAMNAKVVWENYDGAHPNGPYGYERVGFCIGERVFWTGTNWYPNSQSSNFPEAVELAREVVKRWNAGQPEQAVATCACPQCKPRHGSG